MLGELVGISAVGGGIGVLTTGLTVGETGEIGVVFLVDFIGAV